MRVVLNENLHLSFDGVHVHKYQAGDVFIAKSDMEHKVLQDLIDNGKARLLLTTKKPVADLADINPTTEII
jgi:hypothetical protein